MKENIWMIVQKAFKYRFFPSDEQAAQLGRTFGCARYVYNQALEFRGKSWQQEKKSVGYHETASKLTEWKKEPEKSFLSEVSSVVLQQSLLNLKRFRFERSGDGITTMPKPSANICQGHFGVRATQGISQFANCVRLHTLQFRFDLGNTSFLRIEVGRVSGQWFYSCPSRLDQG